MELTLTWKKYESGWYRLEALNVTDVYDEGVYIIWQLPSKEFVYVGQGDIAMQIAKRREDPTITEHRKSGTLYVTWASVPITSWDGIERYLANQYNPMEGPSHPDVPPIPVNLPPFEEGC